MSTYSAVANSEIAVGAPITNNLKTKERDNLLAIQENDASAPTIAYAATAGTAGSVSANSIAPSSDLIDTITTQGVQSVGASSTWTPPQGFYNFASLGSTNLRPELYVNGAWRQTGRSDALMLFCDGSNMRFNNINVSIAQNIYWQRFDG